MGIAAAQMARHHSVILANAGTHAWIPASAGMTRIEVRNDGVALPNDGTEVRKTMGIAAAQMARHHSVILADAGTHAWIPAFAGMT